MQAHRLKPTGDWRAAFNNYLRTMPAYYATPLRRVLLYCLLSNRVAVFFVNKRSYVINCKITKITLFLLRRRALTRMGAGNLASSLVPETLDNCLSYTVLNYLKRLKNQVYKQV